MGEGAPAAARADAGLDPRAPLDPARALVPHAVKLNAALVRRGFLPKLRRLALHVPFAEDALALFFCALDAETPTRTKGLILAGLAYFVTPTDLIPDWVPGLGFTDDAAVLAATVALAGRAIQPRHRERARAKLLEFAGEGAPAAAEG